MDFKSNSRSHNLEMGLDITVQDWVYEISKATSKPWKTGSTLSHQKHCAKKRSWVANRWKESFLSED